MTIKTMWAALLLVVLSVVAPGAQARPPFKDKEGVTCKYPVHQHLESSVLNHWLMPRDYPKG